MKIEKGFSNMNYVDFAKDWVMWWTCASALEPLGLACKTVMRTASFSTTVALTVINVWQNLWHCCPLFQ
jgi:hypothetical protein